MGKKFYVIFFRFPCASRKSTERIQIKSSMILIRSNILCPKTPGVRGLVAPLPVRRLFKYLSHNAFCPVSSLSQCGIKIERTKLGAMHCFIRI